MPPELHHIFALSFHTGPSCTTRREPWKEGVRRRLAGPLTTRDAAGRCGAVVRRREFVEAVRKAGNVRWTVRAVFFQLCLLLGFFTPGALANGRIPNAGLVVVGPASRADVIAVQLTFGVALSRDAGRTWRYACEESYSEPTGWDPPLAIGADGSIILGMLDGIRRSSEGCSWERPPLAGTERILDLAHDATGRTIVAGIGAPGAPNGVMTSDDSGRTWRVGQLVPEMFLTTVEVAPSDPRRVYATMNTSEGRSTLYRSDDGGRTLRVATRTFDGNDAWLSAVDPTNPDVVYVRSTLGLENRILKSTDGGSTFTRIANVEAGLVGFALSDDGSTLWLASSDPDVGLLRSVHGGPFVPTRARASIRCLRYHAGVLYVCGTEATDGWALACSDDGGDTLRPLLAMRAIAGPLTCPAGTTVRDRCEALWPAQQRMLSRDAGPPPEPVPHIDAGADTMDAWGVGPAMDGAMDVSMDHPVDASAKPPHPPVEPVDPGAAMDAMAPRDAAPGDRPTPMDARSVAVPSSTLSRGCACRVAAPAQGLKGMLFFLWATLRRRRGRRVGEVRFQTLPAWSKTLTHSSLEGGEDSRSNAFHAKFSDNRRGSHHTPRR